MNSCHCLERRTTRCTSRTHTTECWSSTPPVPTNGKKPAAGACCGTAQSAKTLHAARLRGAIIKRDIFQFTKFQKYETFYNINRH